MKSVTGWPDCSYSRALINAVFRVCGDPKTAPATAKRLGAVRRQCEEKAVALLAI